MTTKEKTKQTQILTAIGIIGVMVVGIFLVTSSRLRKQSTTPDTSFAGQCAMRFTVGTPGAQTLTSVRINPEMLTQLGVGQKVEMSVLGYDQNNKPISNDNLHYEWGISSSGSVGTLTQGQNKKIALFTALRLGNGDLFVRATLNGVQVFKSIPITVTRTSPVVTPGPTPTSNPTPTPGSGGITSFSFLVKISGVTEDRGVIHAQVTVGSRTSGKSMGKSVALTYAGNDLYKGTVTKSSGDQVNLADPLWMSIKGEKHVKRTFPSIGVDGSSTPLNLTDKPLEPGDLPTQDGTVDNRDINKIVAMFARPTISSSDLAVADVNYDGAINSVDVGLVLATLSTKSDETGF